MTMVKPNVYTVVVDGEWLTKDMYKGTDLKKAIKIFHQFDSWSPFPTYFFINNEMVEF